MWFVDAAARGAGTAYSAFVPGEQFTRGAGESEQRCSSGRARHFNVKRPSGRVGFAQRGDLRGRGGRQKVEGAADEIEDGDCDSSAREVGR